MSEYDPLLADQDSDDLALVEELFARASGPYVSSPSTWLSWALLLPAAALLTTPVLEGSGPVAATLLWGGAILVGGAVEISGIWRGRTGRGSTPLASWVMRAQANLSAVGFLLSVGLLAAGLGGLLPGLWLLLLGHSFYTLGGLAFPPFRATGLLYQAGGAVALLPLGADPLQVFASVAAAGNLWLAWSVWRR